MLGLVPFLAIVLTLLLVAVANRNYKGGPAQTAWLPAGWTIVRQDVNRLLGRASSVSNRVHRGWALEFLSENPPSSAAPFHEIMGGRFQSRWRSYLRVDLGARHACQFQLFERAALVKRPFFSLAPFGAVWLPRWRDHVSTGDARLDSRFEFYAEDPVRASALAKELTATLLAAPPFGLLEVIGSELRIYVSTIAAGLAGDDGTGIAANVNALSSLVVDVATILENA